MKKGKIKKKKDKRRVSNRRGRKARRGWKEERKREDNGKEGQREGTRGEAKVASFNGGKIVWGGWEI